jgi:hypothetical protein
LMAVTIAAPRSPAPYASFVLRESLSVVMAPL